MRTRLLVMAVAVVLGLACRGASPEATRRGPEPDAPRAATVAGGFALERGTISVGEAPVATFDVALPEVLAEQYWMAVCREGEPDATWGQWQYVSAGSTSVTLAAPTEPGAYEVRLHDGYPRVQHHVVQRVALTVTDASQGPAGGSEEGLDEAAASASEGLALAASAGPRTEPATKPLPADRDNPFDGLDFKTEAEVLAAVGPPTASLRKADRTCWYFDREVTALGQRGRPEIQFIEGEVRATIYYPAETMADLIATARLLGGVEPPPPAARRAKKLTFEEAFPLATGKSKAEILGAFGEPTKKRVLEGSEVWQYDDLVEDYGGARRLAIVFEGDVAADVEGM